MSVQVKTTQFQMAHGKMPRGSGSWAFWFGRNGRVDSSNMDAAHWYYGRWSDAKRQAVQAARLNGFDTVEVGS